MSIPKAPSGQSIAGDHKSSPPKDTGERVLSGSTSDEVLTTFQAAKLLKRRPETLRRWRVVGGGPPWVRVGSSPRARCLYLRRHIDAWMEQHTFTSTADESVRSPGRAS